MGYNGSIYRKGEYVEVATPSEIKRLVGYGAVEKDPVTEVKGTDTAEPHKSPEVPEEAGTDIVKNSKRKGARSKK